MKLFKAISWLTLHAAVCVDAFSISSNHRLSSQQTSTHFPTSLSSTTQESVSTSILGTPPTEFDDGVSPYQITTPIYYVNDKPHIGHAYTSVACDVIARFMRLSGREVFFLSGTDEHGQKVEQSAEKKGMLPQDFVDELSKSFQDLLELMDISNDKFIRTTSEDHMAAAKVRRSILQ
jgi:methionyl-tRNA synthetase